MTPNYRIVSLVAVLFAFLTSGEAVGQGSLATGFSSAFGLHSANVPYAVQRARLPDGTLVERFELRSGDCDRSSPDCNNDRERVEFHERGRLQRVGEEVWLGWSIMLPNEFPRQGRRMNVKLGQFHQLGGSGPELLFELDDSSYIVNMRDPSIRDEDPMHPVGEFRRATLTSRNSMLGRWVRVVVNARWSRSQDGFVRVWLNGQLRFSYDGPTTNDDDDIYFRYGVYRSFVSRCHGSCPTLVAYYRDVRRGSTHASVE